MVGTYTVLVGKDTVLEDTVLVGKDTVLEDTVLVSRDTVLEEILFGQKKVSVCTDHFYFQCEFRAPGNGWVIEII